MEESPIHGVNQQVTREDWAYLAGLWDGEGSIGLNIYKAGKTVRYAAHMTFTNTNAAMINEVVRVMDVMGITGHIALRNRNERMPAYQIDIRKFESCKILLENLMPFLKGKKDLASLLLRYIAKRMETLKAKPILTFQRNGKFASMVHMDCYTDDDKELAEQIRALNLKSRTRNLNDYTHPQQSAG